MNSDIRLSVSFWDHWKTIVLKDDLGYAAVESLQRLWCFSAINKPTGKLTGMSSRAIEIAAKWGGTPGVFVEKLIDLNFLEFENNLYSLHDWEEHNSYVIHAPERSEKARKAASARWEKKNNTTPPPPGNQRSDATGNANSNASSNAECNAPSPTPTPTPTPNPKEGKEGGKLADASSPTAPPALSLVRPPCPHETLVALYHETLPELRRCRTLTEARKGYLRQRWHDKPGPDLEKWRAYFLYVRTCPFLMGEKAGTRDRPPFQADLEWLIKPANFAKVIEGAYEEGRAHG